MIYLIEEKIVFFHIPKTAGASITTWMQRHILSPHARIEPLHMLPNRWKRYGMPTDWSFCVVRNPWDRWVSWWYYWRYIAKRFDYSFEEYTEKFFTGQYTGKTGGEHGTCIQQVYYSRHCDSVFRYENLKEDFKQLQERVDVHVPLGKLSNISKNKEHYRNYYTTPRLVDIISDYYRDDIRELGYTYE